MDLCIFMGVAQRPESGEGGSPVACILLFAHFFGSYLNVLVAAFMEEERKVIFLIGILSLRSS
jgi:hypothetical protein